MVCWHLGVLILHRTIWCWRKPELLMWPLCVDSYEDSNAVIRKSIPLVHAWYGPMMIRLACCLLHRHCVRCCCWGGLVVFVLNYAVYFYNMVTLFVSCAFVAQHPASCFKMYCPHVCRTSRHHGVFTYCTYSPCSPSYVFFSKALACYVVVNMHLVYWHMTAGRKQLWWVRVSWSMNGQEHLGDS
jgi:hypothetical protein